MNGNETIDDVSSPADSLRVRIGAFIALLTFVVFVSFGSVREPAGVGHGVLLQSPSPDSPNVANLEPPHRFRLATFNIHGCKGADGSVDVARTAACLEHVDLAGLNEVHGASLFHPDQAKRLAALLNRDYLFAAAERRWWHDDFGNGVLSALPVRSWQRIPLELHGASHYRNILQLKFTVDASVLHVLVTHLESTDAHARQMQWETVLKLFLSLPPPVALLGDLNMSPDDPLIKKLLESGDAADALGKLPAEHPEQRIDWILVRGIQCFDRGSIDAGASDHPCYWVDCEIAE